MRKMKIRRTENGLLIKNGNKSVLLDPGRNTKSPENPDVILVSHVHTDHTLGLPQFSHEETPVVLSEPTYCLLQAKGIQIRNPICVKPGESVDIGELHIETLRSGHMLGSVQFVLSSPFLKKKIAYTGDLAYEDSVLLKRAEIPEADILLLDCTYGNPHYIFPKRRNLYPKIKAKIRGMIADKSDSKIFLHGYPLGKAQELTKIVREVFKETPGVSKRIGKYNSLLEKASNVKLSCYAMDEKQRFQIRGMRDKQEQGHHVFFTGWALRRSYSGVAFPLSAHSDFLELLEFVGEVNPEVVFTLFTFKRQFSEILRRELGVTSSPIPQNSQESRLIDFL